MTEADRAAALLAAIDRLFELDALIAGGSADRDWWMGTCDSAVEAAVEEGLDAEHGATPVWWGGFEVWPDYFHGHCWLEVGSTIVDPTAWQFGRDLDRIVPPGHPQAARYRRPDLGKTSAAA